MLIGHWVVLAAVAMVGLLPFLIGFRSPRPLFAGMAITACTAAAGALLLSLAG